MPTRDPTGGPTSGPTSGQGRGSRVPGPTVPVYVISVAAELTGLHPQTLRQYDRAGLVSPGRTGGGGRRYSLRDIDLLREVAQLTASGIGLEGVRRILELEHQVAALRARNSELRSQVAELQTVLEATLTALHDRRPNLPVLRQAGTVSPFREPR